MVFDSASDITGFEHPLCLECCTVLCKDSMIALDIISEEVAGYENFWKLIEAQEQELATGELDAVDTTQEIELVNLRAELQKLDEELATLKLSQERVELETNTINIIEEKYWENVLNLENQMVGFKEEKDAVEIQVKRCTDHTNLLQRTNLLNDAFHIWHDGHFATINGSRLGTLTGDQVDWNEINAALGYATFLLEAISVELKYQFTTFKPIPHGSNSKMELIKGTDHIHYELYGSADFTFTKLIWNRKFDLALGGFLRCIKELGDHLEKN